MRRVIQGSASAESTGKLMLEEMDFLYAIAWRNYGQAQQELKSLPPN